MSAACAQTAQPPASAPPPRPAAPTDPSATPEARNEAFAQGYAKGINDDTALIRAAGLGSEWTAVRAIVEAHFPDANTLESLSDAQKAVVLRARKDGAANFLLRTGYRVRHLAVEQQARTIVRSAVITAWDNADALVLISPMVVVAALDRVDRKADGSEDLVYRVTERIKSGPAVGSELRMLLHAAPPSPTSPNALAPPPPPNPPVEDLRGYKSAVFFLQAAESVIVPPGAPRPQQPARLFGPMPISGDEVLPSYHSSTLPTTLAALRAAARAQQCSPGYVPVAAATPVRC
jgi:hypothetical protein